MPLALRQGHLGVLRRPKSLNLRGDVVDRYTLALGYLMLCERATTSRARPASQRTRGGKRGSASVHKQRHEVDRTLFLALRLLAFLV